MPDLVRRSKWHESWRNICCGDLVLNVDEDVPRGKTLLRTFEALILKKV